MIVSSFTKHYPKEFRKLQMVANSFWLILQLNTLLLLRCIGVVKLTYCSYNVILLHWNP